MGGWVEEVEENEAVRTSCCELGVWVGEWVDSAGYWRGERDIYRGMYLPTHPPTQSIHPAARLNRLHLLYLLIYHSMGGWVGGWEGALPR